MTTRIKFYYNSIPSYCFIQLKYRQWLSCGDWIILYFPLCIYAALIFYTFNVPSTFNGVYQTIYNLICGRVWLDFKCAVHVLLSLPRDIPCDMKSIDIYQQFVLSYHTNISIQVGNKRRQVQLLGRHLSCQYEYRWQVTSLLQSAPIPNKNWYPRIIKHCGQTTSAFLNDSTKSLTVIKGYLWSYQASGVISLWYDSAVHQVHGHAQRFVLCCVLLCCKFHRYIQRTYSTVTSQALR